MATIKQYIDTDVAPGGDGEPGTPYASLSEWHAAASKNLSGDGNNLIVYCKGDAVDTGGNVDFTGWTTDSTNNLLITTYSLSPLWDGRHRGIEGTGYTFQPTASGAGISIQSNNITFDGIELHDGNALTNPLIRTTGAATNIALKNCIIHGLFGSIPNLGFNQSSTGVSYIYNCFVYDIAVVGAGSPGGIRINDGTCYVYNNTVANMGSNGIRLIAGSCIAKNNLVTDCGVDCFSTVVAYDGSSNYNATDDTTNTGGSKDRINQNFYFENPTFGNPSSPPDLHLVEYDQDARGHGQNLNDDYYISFSTDIDGDERGDSGDPSAGVWDVGADEFIPTYGFSGKMTDIRIYNKVLTQDEVIALYQTSAQLDNKGNLWC